jgi:hypothetical protein
MLVRRNVLRRLKPLKLRSAVAEVTGSSRTSSKNVLTSLNISICGLAPLRCINIIQISDKFRSYEFDCDISDFRCVSLPILPYGKFLHTAKTSSANYPQGITGPKTSSATALPAHRAPPPLVTMQFLLSFTKDDRN